MSLTESICELLKDLDDEFIPSLSTTVVIPSYVDKIISGAKILSYHEEGKLSAFIAFYCNDTATRISYMTMLAVSKKNRGKGLAMALIESSIELIKKEGFKYYRLEVYKSNLKAIALYQKFGFTTVSESEISFIMELGID